MNHRPRATIAAVRADNLNTSPVERGGTLTADVCYLASAMRVYNQSASQSPISYKKQTGESMDIPVYVTKEEVRRVCAQIGIRDWTKLSGSVELKEAEVIRTIVGGEALMISAEAFKQGLDVELEHGMQFPDANVTNNHPLLTGMIVLAHLKEMLDYYQRLDVAELEGDIFKAFAAGDHDRLARKYQLLIEARAQLAQEEQTLLSS